MAPATRSRKTKPDEGNIVDNDVSAEGSRTVTESPNGTSLPVRAKDGDVPEPTKGKLVVFGDDDENDTTPLNVATTVVGKVPQPDVVEEEDEDSDDDAPEAVSTHKAALDVKKAAQAVQKAAHEQAAVQKRKRRQRNELFKQQAEERKKVDQDEKAATVAAADAAAGSSNSDDDDEEASIQQQQQQNTDANTSKRRTARLAAPATLPLEFLTDSSSDEEDEEDGMRIDGRPKRRKVSGIEKRLTRQDKGPKDERIGATVYRVGKKTDERLAPKLKKYTKSTKEGLLKRNRQAVKPKAGFFTKK